MKALLPLTIIMSTLLSFPSISTEKMSENTPYIYVLGVAQDAGYPQTVYSSTKPLNSIR